ncbi:DUF1573 domain-containing protein [uncultured Alistipes sp.]|uniref:DUF1573 domain-containing protein n=1 Tax=uncultured Alistipes sp. TaxID=538949 RepID=UPI002616BB50|nr:DUF1573 domain-containing protein [uncultured Alistipes sp.]
MRKFVWTCIGCLLLATGQAVGRTAGAAERSQRDAVAESSPKKGENPSRRERRNGSAQQGGALLRLEESVYDFGRVPRRGGDLVHDFVVENEGTVPLVVTRVFTSCSCLKASYSKRPIPPGGTGVIRITYEPYKSEPGTFYKVIQVYSNSTEGRTVITVQGSSYDDEKEE